MSCKWSHKLDSFGKKNVSFSSNSTYDSIAYDPVKPRLLKLEAETEEPTNGDAWNQALRLPYSCNPDNLVSIT